MPLPKPHKDEEKDKFIERCMSDLKEEFPDNDQRLAVCFAQWKKKDEKSGFQRRFLPANEFRIVEDGKAIKLVGHAAVFNTLTEDMWGFRERVAKGAFKDTLARKDDVRMLFNHDPNFVIARTTNNTLILREDDRGLYFEAIPADTQWEKDLIIKIKRGDITQNSFGFMIDEEEWDHKEKIRTLTSVRLFDVSPVTYPAYKDTEIHVRWKNGETIIPVKQPDENSRKKISDFIEKDSKGQTALMNQYGISQLIYSASPSDPTMILLPGHSLPTDKGKTNPPVVEPRIPLIDPVRWSRIKERLQRRK